MKDEELIQCVQKYRYLYDKSDPLHKSKKNTQEGWAEIAAVFQVKVQVVRKRWAYLRDYFRKQKQSYDSIKSEEWFAKKKKWALYDSLTFLLPSMEYHNTTISDGVSETHQYPDLSDDTSKESISLPFDSHFMETVISQENMPICQQPERKRTKKDLDNQFFSGLRGQHEDDDHEHFFKSLLPGMRTLNPLAAMEYRQEVQGLLIEYIKKDECTGFAEAESS
ncbi:hypothetical protein BsWGS_08978 [Bradybaena similaris]